MPCVRKSSNLSMQEILVVMSAYARPSSVRTGSGGDGRESQGNRGGNAIFSWPEIAQCAFTTVAFEK